MKNETLKNIGYIVALVGLLIGSAIMESGVIEQLGK